MAKFSLGFLKENSINEFLMAYYENSKEGKEWVAKSRKEKVKKIKDLAENLKPEEKEKVTNSEAAKMMERSAIKSGIFGGVAAIGAGVASGASIQAHNAQAHTDAARRGMTRSFEGPSTYPDQANWVGFDGSGTMYLDNRDGNGIQISTHKNSMGDTMADARLTDRSYNVITSAITALSTICFGAMWGSLIAAGSSIFRAGVQAHKANVMRREEILQQLMQSKKKE